MREPLTVEAVAADLLANAEHLRADPELNARLATFAEAARNSLGELVLNALLEVMEFIEETPEADQDLAHRMAACELLRAAAMVIWGLKQRDGSTYRPAGIAAVAYEMAVHVAHSAVANDDEHPDA